MKTQSETHQLAHSIEILSDQDGQRIDNFLTRHMKGVPKSHLYRLLRTGQVRVNKGRIKPNYRLKTGDIVRLPPARILETEGEANVPPSLVQEIGRRILFEDADCLVIDKPSGLAVHGGSGLQYGVLDVLRQFRPGLEFLELAHRLDRETSGCLLLAKNLKSLTCFHDQIRKGSVVKKYLAGLVGTWKHGKKTVSAPLRKNALQGGERMVEVAEDGKEAVTHFVPLQQYSGICLVEVELETGRTHQIRVHAAHIGHPVAGDRKYGDKDANRRFREQGLTRLFLHAHRLDFSLPGRSEVLQIHAPLSTELQEFLNRNEHA